MSLSPLIDSSSSERARELLRAARADRPRPGASQRTLTALGIAGTTATATGAALASAGAQASGAASLSTLGLPLLAAKWVVLGTLGGLALASGATLTFSSPAAAPAPSALPAPPSASRNATAAAALNPQPSPPTPQPELEPVVTSPKPTTSVAVARGKPMEPTPTPALAEPSAQGAFQVPEQSKLLRDMALLDDARHALKAGDSVRALALLTRYAAERQTHVLDREAELLRQRARAAGAK